MKLHILADKDIPYLDDFLPEDIRLTRFDPLKEWSSINPDVRSNCEALMIRTVSRLDVNHFDPGLFPALKFVGTASAGFDHVDVRFLEKNGITFFEAGGANAQAVGEYVTSIVVQWCLDFGKSIEECTVGIVGFGHTGSKVGSIMEQLGCMVIAHDPPKEIRDKSFKSADIDKILSCDIITFHVPFTEHTSHPTKFWMNAQKLANFSGSLIINAARGGVVQEDPLLQWQKENPGQRRFAIDVWENEPMLNKLIADSAWIATPHIAGYSVQSKRNATRIVLKSLLNFFEYSNSIAESCTSYLNLNAYNNWHPLFELSDQLKDGLTDDTVANSHHFRSLRQHSKLRNEFKFTAKGTYEKLSNYPLIQKLIEVCGGPI